MTTKALYLINPSALEAEGLIIQVDADEQGAYIVCDQTPAYPQGGGQQGDSGTIYADGQAVAFRTTKAAGDSIRHYLDDTNSLKQGQAVTISVHPQIRRRNTILHSAGHFVACLAHLLCPGLIPVKGHHFAEGSYVELSGAADLSLVELEQFLKAATALGLRGSQRIFAETAKPGVLPDSPFLHISLPEGKPIRLVTIEGFPPMACGGTHVSRLAEIPAIRITKIKWSKDVLRISYKCFEDETIS